MHDPLEKMRHAHSLMGELEGSSCSPAEGVVEGSLMEAEAMVGNGEGCANALGNNAKYRETSGDVHVSRRSVIRYVLL